MIRDRSSTRNCESIFYGHYGWLIKHDISPFEPDHEARGSWIRSMVGRVRDRLTSQSRYTIQHERLLSIRQLSLSGSRHLCAIARRGHCHQSDPSLAIVTPLTDRRLVLDVANQFSIAESRDDASIRSTARRARRSRSLPCACGTPSLRNCPQFASSCTASCPRESKCAISMCSRSLVRTSMA